MNKWLVMMLVSLPAAAIAASDDRSLYFGLGVGEANVDLDVDLGVRDDTSDAWRVYGGYELNRYLGVELGYLKMDDLEGQTPSIEGPVRTRFDLDGWTLGGVGQWAFAPRWVAQAHLGLLFWDADARIDSPLGVERIGDTGTDPYYGLSLGRELGRSWQLLGQWTRYETDGSDFDFVNLAVTWRMPRS